jgi:hypothetical protein
VNQEFIPRVHDLDEILLSLKAKKENNNASVDEALSTRESQHAAFVQQTNEFTEALRGIDECLELIEEMSRSGDVRASFVEVSSEQHRKITSTLKQIRAKTE